LSGPWIRALAPAKVNLTLEVLAKRPDGFHEIRSWMLAIDLVDVVRVRTNTTGVVTLSVSGPAASADIPLDERNLAVRAALGALATARAGGTVADGIGLEIELTKTIPSQAGLGGGSSDAAAAWIATSAACGAPHDTLRQEIELARLGSDCVFFGKAYTGIGIATSRGEVVEVVTTVQPRWMLAVVTPECVAATALVYARALPRESHAPSLRPRLTGTALDAASTPPNDLERAAIAAIPDLAAWRALLDDLGLTKWRLAGSGSSWFGLYDDRAEAERALQRVEHAARASGLGIRLARAVRAAGHGAVLVPET